MKGHGWSVLSPTRSQRLEDKPPTCRCHYIMQSSSSAARLWEGLFRRREGHRAATNVSGAAPPRGQGGARRREMCDHGLTGGAWRRAVFLSTAFHFAMLSAWAAKRASVESRISIW